MTKWIALSSVVKMHARLIELHGGSDGIRDRHLLESALARPRNMAAYESNTGLVDLAASYASAISQNHPFVDGNKRVAFMAAYSFLEANGLHLTASNTDAEEMFLGLASGSVREEQLRDWLAIHTEPIEASDQKE